MATLGARNAIQVKIKGSTESKMTANIEIGCIPIFVEYENTGGTDTGYQDVHHDPTNELDRSDNEILFCKPSLKELEKLGISEEEVQERIDEL